MNKRINVTMPSMPPFEEYIEELRPVWESKWISNRGPAHIRLEEQLKNYLGAEHVSLFANGHLSLEVMLSCFGQSGGEIITTPYTHCSTLHSIVRSGFTPVFCDVKENDLTLNPELIKDKITEKTVAIMPVHVYGFICDDEKISALAKKHGLRVIYDAAHAFGVRSGGISAANLGDAAMFSLHATKVFQTIEGGLVTYSDVEFFQPMAHIVNFGFTSPEDVRYIGTNARMNEFEAVMGICNLRHFDEEVLRRKRVYDRYVERLSGNNCLRLFEVPAATQWNYAYMPVVVNGHRENRDILKDRLERENIYVRKYFYPLVTKLGCYADRYGALKFPVAEDAAQRILTLPMYSELRMEDVDRICDVIVEKQSFIISARMYEGSKNAAG